MKRERQKINKEILKKIDKLVDMFPDQRFGQILVNYVFLICTIKTFSLMKAMRHWKH